MTVSELTEKKTNEIADRCFAKHPEMGKDGAIAWAKKQPVVVTLKMTAPDGNNMVIEVINGIATVVINNNGATRRSFRWSDVEAKFMANCKLNSIF